MLRKIAGRDWNRQKWTWKLRFIKDGKSSLLGERTREKKASKLPMEASGTSAMNCLGRTVLLLWDSDVSGCV